MCLSRSVANKQTGYEDIQNNVCTKHAYVSDIYIIYIYISIYIPRRQHVNLGPWVQSSKKTFEVQNYLVSNKESFDKIWVFPTIGLPQNGWFVMEHPNYLNGWLEGTLFFGNTHIAWGHIAEIHWKPQFCVFACLRVFFQQVKNHCYSEFPLQNTATGTFQIRHLCCSASH